MIHAHIYHWQNITSTGFKGLKRQARRTRQWIVVLPAIIKCIRIKTYKSYACECVCVCLCVGDTHNPTITTHTDR